MSLAAQVTARKKATKILVIDIERLPGLARAWEPKTRYVPIQNFTRLPSLLCFAAKWHGQKRVEFQSAWKDRDAMVQRSWELYDQADIVVTYNGVGFDNKHLRSEWLLAGMPPPSPWKDVDLYRVNRQTFGFESKSLNHLCYVLGLDTKSGHYDPVMAERCMDGDKQAQKTMRIYNVGDVEITEQAYVRLQGWMPGHPHMGTLAENETVRCNQCGSDDVVRNGLYRAVVIDYMRYRCNNCGANIRGGYHSRAAVSRGVK